MAVTRKEVAKRAGVSTATVSNVINESKYVSKELTKRVQTAIKELNYKPNLIAKSLKTKRSKQVAILIDDITNPYFNEIILGFETEAKKRGYITNIGIGNNSTNEYFNDFLSRNIDGVFIIMNTKAKIPFEKIKEMSEHGTVIVNTLEDNPYQEYSSNIYVDYIGGIQKIFEHLIKLGHRKIAFIDFINPRAECNISRYLGYKNCLKIYNLPYDENKVIFGTPPYNSTYEEGYKYMKELITRKTDMTAVIIINDYMATGALTALKEENLQVPDDISLVSIDNTIFSRVTTPRLTSLNVDNKLNGIKAMTLIDEMITGNIDHSNIEVPTNLVVRDSTVAING